MSVISHSNATTIVSSEESRALRIAAFFTMAVTGFYPLLFLGAGFLSILLTGDIGIPDLSTRAGLAYADRFPTAALIGFLADGFSHVTSLLKKPFTKLINKERRMASNASKFFLRVLAG